MKFAINPPNTPLVNLDRTTAPEWYRYFVQQRKQGDDITDSDVLTFGPAQEIYPNSRALAVESGELTSASDDTSLTLGLADVGTAGDYGSATRVLILTIDAKGRVSSAQEVQFDISDVLGKLAVANGGTNIDSYTVGDLIYADGVTSLAKLADVATGNVLRSGGVGVAPAWGKVNVTTDVTGGFTGTGAYTNFTIVNGIITAAS